MDEATAAAPDPGADPEIAAVTPRPGAYSIRASDGDRGRVIDQLRAHFGQGRLSMTELDERMGAAYQARTLDDLWLLVRDLPASGTTPPPAPTAYREPAVQRPAARAERRPAAERRGKAAHVAAQVHFHTWLWVNLLCLAIWVMTSPGGYFWPMWVLVPWGIVVAAQFTATRAARDRHRQIEAETTD